MSESWLTGSLFCSLGLVLGLTCGLTFAASRDTDIPATGPLRVSSANPRYFADPSGKIVYLTGSHVWNSLQDMGETDPPPPFDWQAYLDFLQRYHHNFVRLWRWELVSWDTSSVRRKAKLTTAPHPWKRTGPGQALDGKPKFDLMQFDEAYFTRLRQRVRAARDRGIYVSIMLFEGWGLQRVPSAWKAHPFHSANNVNGIDGDANGDSKGLEIHTLSTPPVTTIQEAYVCKVVDTVNDLDNVLFEVSNENHPPSTEWQYHIIRYVRQYEKQKPKQHPIGMTFQFKGGKNATLLKSLADWISPNPQGGYRDNPPAADGRKIVISDTDHLWGIGGNQAWVWKSFLRGMNPIFMDPYDGVVLGNRFDPKWNPIRVGLGYTRRLAQRLNLASCLPRNDLSSTRYCLANPGEQYLVNQPRSGRSFTVTLAPGRYRVEWLNPSSGEVVIGLLAEGGAPRRFSAPFQGDAVLYLHQQAQGKARAHKLTASPPKRIPSTFRLRVSENGRYLVDQNGKPFFWLGDTGWALFSTLSKEDTERYLENRRRKGLNVIQCILARWGCGSPGSTLKAIRPWLNGNPATPNERYFEFVDDILKLAQEKGILLALLPAWGAFVTEDRTLNVTNARAYGQWLGVRYRNTPNIVWVLGGDQPPTGFERVFRELAAGLKEGDGGRHLMTYHPRGGQQSSTYWHQEEWLDFNMMQSGHSVDLPNYAMILADRAMHPIKPSLDGEPRYENIINGLKKKGPRINAHQVRKAAYNAILSGAAGHTYGANGVFQFWRPGVKNRWTPEVPWQKALDFPGAEQVGLMKSLMVSHAWRSLEPDPDVVLSGCGKRGTYTPAARSSDRQFACVYIPEAQTVTIDMACINGAGVIASWFDPRTGTVTPIGEFPASGRQTFSTVGADGDPDYVLLLESSGPETTPPAIEHVYSWRLPDKVVAAFSEPLEKSTATSATNYKIGNGVKVTNATLGADGRTVTLTTSKLQDKMAYVLKVRAVRDLSPLRNVIAAGAKASFVHEAIPRRSRKGLRVLYTFNARDADVVRDVSGVQSSINLVAPAAVELGTGWLKVAAPALIASKAPAAKIITACRKSNELSVEVVIKPFSTEQDGPARIVTLSANSGLRNFTLGQSKGSYIARLRTTTTSPNGIPDLVSPPTDVSTRLTHVVYTRDAAGQAHIFVNGVRRASGFTAGDFSTWSDAFRLALANELTKDRSWLGELRLVAIYSSALTPLDILRHCAAAGVAE